MQEKYRKPCINNTCTVYSQHKASYSHVCFKQRCEGLLYPIDTRIARLFDDYNHLLFPLPVTRGIQHEAQQNTKLQIVKRACCPPDVCNYLRAQET